MKKILYFFLLAMFLGCGSASSLLNSDTSNNWYGVEMRPSQVSTSGITIYAQPLKNQAKEHVKVYYDVRLQKDGTYYYNQLWASYGWTRNGDTATASAYAMSPSYSTLHISVKRGVAIYMYPNGTWDVFRVEKTKPTYGNSED